MSLEYYSAWLVWTIPLISSLFVPIIGRYSEKIRNYFAVGIAVLTAALALSLVPSVWFGDGEAITYSIPWISEFVEAGIYIDPLSILFTCLISFFAVIITVYSLGYMKGESGLTRYYSLILLFIGSMIGLVLADNMLQMFIFWEMVGLCSFALIAFWYKKPESVHSGTKAFIMTRIGDIALLAAIGILFLMFGTFSFHGTINAIQAAALNGSLDTGLLVVAAFLILIGAIAKSAQLPLFTWLYSAMEAPTSVSALLHAATMVKAGIYLLARVILIFSAAPVLIEALQPLWFPTVAWIGVLTAIAGAALALTTTDIKGVLAYSTISQIGFMMASLGASVEGAASLGWFASLFHMMSHAFFEGLGFLLAGGIIHALHTRDMQLMGGLRKAMPITFVLGLIMIITTSGLPPFAAFFSKGLILTSVAEIGTTAGLIQTIILFAATAITFAYCIRMFSLVFMGKPSEQIEKNKIHEAPKIMLIPSVILAAFCIIWGLSQPIVTSLMHIEIELSLIEAFTSLEFPIFMGLLAPVFILAYWSYYKNFKLIRNVAKSKNPLSTLLNRKYFADDLNFTVIKGIEKLSFSSTRLDGLMNQLLSYIAKGTERVSRSFVHIDHLLDQTVNSSAALALRTSLRLNRLPLKTYQNYIAAIVLGIIIIVIVIVLTAGGL
jgi:NADH-quinone oxidoreductase subunit L